MSVKSQWYSETLVSWVDPYDSFTKISDEITSCRQHCMPPCRGTEIPYQLCFTRETKFQLLELLERTRKGPDLQSQITHSLTPWQNSLVDKLYPWFWTQNLTDEVQLTLECLRYFLTLLKHCRLQTFGLRSPTDFFE